MVAQVLEEVGPFALHELIGTGGTAEVWRATDRRTARTVAVKLLSAKVAENDGARARFLREAKHAARVDDPHVVPIYDFGDVEGRLYISMRLVEGPNLAQMITASPLAPERAVEIITQVASALTAAHKVGLVHRDVKPSNILMTTDHTGADFAYLADFGITRSITGETALTHHGMVIGTPEYISPEQYRGHADPLSDQYALGCVLFACLAGRVPFPQPDPAAQMMAKLHGEIPRLSAFAPWAEHLDQVVGKAMATEPHSRHRTVAEFAAVAKRAVAMRDFRLKDRRTSLVRPWKGLGPEYRFGVPLADFARPTVSYKARRKAMLVGVAIATAAVLLTGAVIAALTLGSGSSSALPPLPAVGAPIVAPAPVSTALPRQVSTLAVAGRPETVAISRDGSKAWMTTSNPAAPAVHLIDTATNTVQTTIPLPGVPRFVVLNPSTDNAYVTYNDLAANKLLVAGVDATQRQIVKTIDTGQVADRKTGQTWLFVSAMSKDGTRLYVPHHDRSVVSVIDTVTNTAVAQIAMPKNPHAVAIAPDGRRALVTAHMSGEVDEIDLATNQFVRSIPIGPNTSPHDVDISPDGRVAHVANFDAGTISVVDMATSAIVATVPVGGKPQSVVFAADGRRSYVVDNKTNQLHTIDAATSTITGTVQVSPGASMVALSPDGTRAWVSSRDSSQMTTFLTAA